MVPLVIANRAFFTKQGWSTHKLGTKRAQTRAKRAQIRAKRAQIEKMYRMVPLSFSDRSFIILYSILRMRAFGSCILMSPRFGTPLFLLTTSSLSAFGYTAGLWGNNQVIFGHLQNIPSIFFAVRFFFCEHFPRAYICSTS